MLEQRERAVVSGVVDGRRIVAVPHVDQLPRVRGVSDPPVRRGSRIARADLRRGLVQADAHFGLALEGSEVHCGLVDGAQRRCPLRQSP